MKQKSLFADPDPEPPKQEFYEDPPHVVEPLYIPPLTDAHREAAKKLKHGIEALEWAEEVGGTVREMIAWHNMYFVVK